MHTQDNPLAIQRRGSGACSRKEMGTESLLSNSTMPLGKERMIAHASEGKKLFRISLTGSCIMSQ